MNSVELFENSIEWLKNNYPRLKFYLERDIVYTLQTHLRDTISKNSLPFKVHNDYPVLWGANNRRHLCADLVITPADKKDGILDIAAEFKYEPDHNRKNIDILESKLKPAVVFWDGKNSVQKDVERARQYVKLNKASYAYSIFIDEGKYFFEKKKVLPDSEWRDWGKTAVLIAKFNR